MRTLVFATMQALLFVPESKSFGGQSIIIIFVHFYQAVILNMLSFPLAVPEFEKFAFIGTYRHRMFLEISPSQKIKWKYFTLLDRIQKRWIGQKKSFRLVLWRKEVSLSSQFCIDKKKNYLHSQKLLKIEHIRGKCRILQIYNLFFVHSW